MKTKIGILGGGQVASHLIELIQTETDAIDIVKVAVKDLSKERSFTLPMTINLSEVTTDESIKIIVDCLPGIEIPRQAMLEAIERNKNIVSCGKEIWHHRQDSDIIIEKALEKNITIWLNSIVSNKEYNYNVIWEDLNEKTIRNYPDDFLYKNREGDAKATAHFIFKDLFKSISKIDEVKDID